MGKLLCALVLVTSASISFGQTTTTATKAGSDKVEEEIRILHQTIREAVRRHDKAALEAIYADENVWLSQKMMAQLYDVEVPTINYHLKNVFEDSELEEDSVVRKFRITDKAYRQAYRESVRSLRPCS